MKPQQIKIAVIDSDGASVANITGALEGKGYQVQAYGGPDELLSAAQAKPPHVVLADIATTGGLSFVEKLQKRDRQIIVLAITSEPSVEAVVAAMRLGVFDYLIKPVDSDRLVRSLETALARRGMFLTRPETINKIIGARLREIRREQNLTTQQLADRVGVTQSQISQIETGRSAASIVTLYNISQALSMSLSELLRGI